ncbi:MAG TPA: FecR domain-containing protein [Myxococcales bacterium]|nr:FecR domain-containing protein [Myxococcales bacterium]
MRIPATLLFAAAVFGSACRCDSQRPAPTPTPRAEAAPAQPGIPAAVLTGKSGAVELQRGSGPWTPAAAGDRIRPSDGLRTRPDAEAEISVDGVRVKLHDRSELRLAAVSPGLVRARVHGRVESEVAAGKGHVSLQVDEGAAVADSDGGHFLLTGEGTAVVVASTEGGVEVTSGGKTVQVNEGQIARVERDGLLDQPSAALKKVLLAVRWPGEKTNRSSIPLSGRVASGSRVYVQGELVEVAPSGEFRADVRLRDGRQKIAVVTVDPLGRRMEAESQVTRGGGQ